MKVLILSGGSSNEREVSLRSGKNVADAMGQTVTVLDPASEGFDLTEAVREVDMVFPILHGAGGEDGSIQLQLEKLGVPFLGSGSKACALTFNKVKLKETLAEHGVLTPNWEVVDKVSFGESGLTRKPYVLKPIEGGSSIDAFLVHNPGHQSVNFDEAFDRYGQMLLEELIVGQEITVSVLDYKALPIILIIPPDGEEFDYENKYNGKSQEIVEPREVSQELTKTAQRLAEKIHRLCGLRHLSRTDMIVASDGAIYTLETNTIPGLTGESLFPKSAKAAGLSIEQLTAKFVDLVASAHQASDNEVS